MEESRGNGKEEGEEREGKERGRRDVQKMG
jgi:hypothetical protein